MGAATLCAISVVWCCCFRTLFCTLNFLFLKFTSLLGYEIFVSFFKGVKYYEKFFFSFWFKAVNDIENAQVLRFVNYQYGIFISSVVDDSCGMKSDFKGKF